MRFEVQPDQYGIVYIQHDLGTTDVTVTCEDWEGRPIGYLLSVVVDSNRLEVSTVPGSRVTAVRVEPAR